MHLFLRCLSSSAVSTFTEQEDVRGALDDEEKLRRRKEREKEKEERRKKKEAKKEKAKESLGKQMMLKMKKEKKNKLSVKYVVRVERVENLPPQSLKKYVDSIAGMDIWLTLLDESLQSRVLCVGARGKDGEQRRQRPSPREESEKSHF